MADDEASAQVEIHKLDAEAYFRSLNGFEEISLEQLFRCRLKTLADNETQLMRALLVVEAKRAGANDADAFHNVMLLALDAVTDRFQQPDAGDLEDEDPDAQAERDREYARFVVGVGVSFMPEQYRALTIGQRAALIDAANRR